MRRTGEARQANRDIILGSSSSGFEYEWQVQPGVSEDCPELCDQFKLPLMTHISFAPPETTGSDGTDAPGDVVTHCLQRTYAGHCGSGRENQAWSAGSPSTRGLFDVGHGLGSFNFPAARKAMQAGSCQIPSRRTFTL
jgi:predicted amidohydrolase